MNMIKYSKLSNHTIRQVIKHFCIDIDATKTSQLLELNRHTINKYYLLFRKAIYLVQLLELSNIIGEVELDESYFGARRIRGFHGKLKRGRGTNKQPVFGIFKRDNIFGRETVYTEIVPDCKKKTLQGIIKGKVDLASTITTDGWRGYDGLVDVGYDKHFRCNHSKNEFAVKGTDGATITVNGIESFWSFTKRRLAKFNGSKKYFELHLKECEWRWGKTTPELIDSLAKILKGYDNNFLA
jgi:transposase-like protein